MNIIPTDLKDVYILEPIVHGDHRGWFMESWSQRTFEEHGLHYQFVQDNHSYSAVKGTLRGLHCQKGEAAQAKLVRCTRGAIFDVVLDLRPDSPSCGAWHGVELSEENGRMLYLPEGCAHGYQTLRPDTEMHYMTSAFYAPASATGVRFDDPAFGIAWPLPVSEISEQDRNWPLMRRIPSDAAQPQRLSA